MHKTLKNKISKSKIILSLFFISYILFFIFRPPAGASSLNQTYIRLNNLNSSAPLSGTICADPSAAGAGTEAKIAITFPSDFTINTTASNWTTSISNLPAGATAWPSIGANATTVSNKTVTFSSGDLTANSLYCFNFTGNSSTTGTAGTEKTGAITSKNSSDITIDSTTYALAIASNGSINITASVDPQASDLPIAIESTTPGSNFPQDTTLNYTITYGSLSTTAVPLTIQAEWTQGTVGSNPSPSVDILDYVIGSATNAYNSTSPVIDSTNKTITWTISSFPANTVNKIVTFSLKTNSSYTGSSVVSFDILARATSGSTTTPDESITQTYLYSSVSPTSTPTPTTGASATLTPTPTLTPSALLISDISIRNLTQSEAQIYVETSNETNLSLKFGTSLNDLSTKITTALYKTQNLITLPNLTADTSYYFKVTATDQNGKTVTSDIFTFKTAYTSDILKADVQTFIAASNNVILVSPVAGEMINNQKNQNIITIPVSTIFTVQFKLAKQVPLKVAQLIVRNKNVLGISTMEADASSDYVNLTQTEPGVYVGKLKSLPVSGQYEIYVRLIDFNGNITEQKISDLIVANKFTILEKDTDKPIENARILLYLYDQETKVYKLISPQGLSITNPSFSKPDGTLDLVLLKGKYKAEISALNYESKTIEFEINNQGGYPLIELTKQPFNIINQLNYYKNGFVDTFKVMTNFVRERADSNRLFDLITMSAIFIFVTSTITAFSIKTHIPIFYLPFFLIYKTNLLLKRSNSYVLLGQVIEKIGQNPVSKAIVNLMDANNNTIATLKTNKLGEFYYPNMNLGDYKILVIKDGFENSPLISFNETSNTPPFTIEIKKDASKLEEQARSYFAYIIDFTGMMFEFMLICGIIIEIFLVSTFGIMRIAPFMTITILNFLLFFLFLYKPRHLESN